MAIKDAQFNNSGTEFCSTSYDRYIKIWDTETGQWSNLSYLYEFLSEIAAGLRTVGPTTSAVGPGTQVLNKTTYATMVTFAGECKSRLTTGKVPFCAKYNPDDDKQHFLLTGMQDKKVIQVSKRIFR